MSVTGIPAAALLAFTRMTRLTDSQAAQLGMASWRERYPVPVPDAADGSRRLNSQDRLAPATRYCPDCLAGDGSAIQEASAAPGSRPGTFPSSSPAPCTSDCWSTAAPTAGAVRGLRPGATSTLLPAMRAAGLHPAQCRAERTLGKGGRARPGCCGARLNHAGRRRPASPQIIALQDKILGILDSGSPATTLSAGLPTPPSATSPTSGDRAAGLLDLARSPEPQPWRGGIASAIDEHVALAPVAGRWPPGRLGSAPAQVRLPPGRRRSQRRTGSYRGPHPRRNPRRGPRPATAVPPGQNQERERSYWGLRMSRSVAPCSEGLYAAYAPLFWGFTKSGSQPQGRRNAIIRPQRWGPENIPAFLPQDWHDRYFTPIPGVSDRFTRRTVSLRLVQIVAGGSLGEAAGFLGIASTDTPGSERAGSTPASATSTPGPGSSPTPAASGPRSPRSPASSMIPPRRWSTTSTVARRCRTGASTKAPGPNSSADCPVSRARSPRSGTASARSPPSTSGPWSLPVSTISLLARSMPPSPQRSRKHGPCGGAPSGA